MSTTTNTQMNYNEFLNKLQSQGLKTTSTGANEANFSTYGNALSDSLKSQIMDSFDRDEDYEIQANIAGLFKGKGSNFMDSSSFVSGCQSLGYNVKVEYQSTSYISDYKAGNYSNSVSNGAIAVYTISDGHGGEIKIADANGNGGLETEEVFMNNILGDVMKDISIPTNASGASAASASSGSNSTSGNKADEKVSQADYNDKVEEYLERGFSENLAKNLANSDLDVFNMTYTGNADKVKEENGEKEAEVSQSEYNTSVEKYLKKGYSLSSASEKSDNDFDVTNMQYTGDVKEEDLEELYENPFSFV